MDEKEKRKVEEKFFEVLESEEICSEMDLVTGGSNSKVLRSHLNLNLELNSELQELSNGATDGVMKLNSFLDYLDEH